jgi:hypothetical protein
MQNKSDPLEALSRRAIDARLLTGRTPSTERKDLVADFSPKSTTRPGVFRNRKANAIEDTRKAAREGLAIIPAVSARACEY